MRIEKRFIKLGTGSDEVSGSDIPANHTESNYTSSSSDIAGHLSGIDTALGLVPSSPAGDLNEVSFSLANNVFTFSDVTGVSFSNASVRSAEIEYSIYIDATVDVFESGKIMAVQKSSGWVVSRQVNGDNSQILLDINNSGQLQYRDTSFTGFVSGVIKVRARTTTI